MRRLRIEKKMSHRPRKYSDDQISAALAMAVMQPRPSIHEIAKATGMKFASVRYYVGERSKAEVLQPWSREIIAGCSAICAGNRMEASVHFNTAAGLAL